MLARPGALEQNVEVAVGTFLRRVAAMFDESAGAGRILAGIWTRLLIASGALILGASMLSRLLSGGD